MVHHPVIQKEVDITQFYSNIFVVAKQMDGLNPILFLHDLITTGGSHLSRIIWEHENLSGLSVIFLISTNLHVSWSCMILAENLG